MHESFLESHGAERNTFTTEIMDLLLELDRGRECRRSVETELQQMQEEVYDTRQRWRHLTHQLDEIKRQSQPYGLY